MQAEKITMETLKEIADLAAKKNIPVASHDDDTVEKLDVIQMYNASISEFPITLEVAKAAQERGLLTVVGAPNVMLGGSHSGNLSAAEAVRNGVVDILCSDYYPPALLHAVFKLAEEGQDLVEMIKLLTINPAKAAKIDHLTGSIEKNKLADIVIINFLKNNLPTITHVFTNGTCTLECNYRR